MFFNLVEKGSPLDNSPVKLRIYRDRIAGVVGNFLEHYDNALFGLLSPFIAPLFFEGTDPLTALILTYSMLPLGLITRPLGSIIFGWIGDYFGRRQALFLSLTGMAIITVLMGCLPLYKDIGPWAPFFLALGRMLQGFFAAGEVAGGAIFVLEHTPPSNRSLTSSCYDACSIGGILLASGLVTWMSAQNLIEEGWRYLFWTGGITAILGIILRWKSSEMSQAPLRDRKEINAILPSGSVAFISLRSLNRLTSSLARGSVLKKYIWPFLGIFFASGFSYTTYSFAFTLMNGFVPLVTSLSKTQVMQVNTFLLIYDMLLLPVMGYLASRFGKERVMIAGAICSVFFAIPMFYLLDHASLGLTVAIRFVIISSGVAFSAPYYAWAIEHAPPRHRYLILSLAGAFGSQMIGMPTSAICLWLYQTLRWSWAPGLYLQTTGALAGLTVFLFMRKEKSPVLKMENPY